jgi:hypothetical protein
LIQQIEAEKMDHRQLFRAALLSLAIATTAAAPAMAAKPPTTWDGLIQLKSKRFDLVYLAPGASFAGYTKVILDPTEVAFEKNWRRDYNNEAMGITGNVSEKDLQKIITEGVAGAHDILTDKFNKGGYPVVTEPGPDVLWIRTGVLDVRVSAPDVRSAGRTYSFANDAGEATYFIEVRDSVTGALLGRAVDRRLAGDMTIGQRNIVTNRADFRQLLQRWADLSIRGLNALKAQSPISDTGQPANAPR